MNPPPLSLSLYLSFLCCPLSPSFTILHLSFSKILLLHTWTHLLLLSFSFPLSLHSRFLNSINVSLTVPGSLFTSMFRRFQILTHILFHKVFLRIFFGIFRSVTQAPFISPLKNKTDMLFHIPGPEYWKVSELLSLLNII